MIRGQMVRGLWLLGFVVFLIVCVKLFYFPEQSSEWNDGEIRRVKRNTGCNQGETCKSEPNAIVSVCPTGRKCTDDDQNDGCCTLISQQPASTVSSQKSTTKPPAETTYSTGFKLNNEVQVSISQSPGPQSSTTSLKSVKTAKPDAPSKSPGEKTTSSVSPQKPAAFKLSNRVHVSLVSMSILLTFLL